MGGCGKVKVEIAWPKLKHTQWLVMDDDANFSPLPVSGSLYRAGSKKNLSGDPQEALFEAIELGKVEAVASLIDNGLVTKFNT